jgi:hypothetical protein
MTVGTDPSREPESPRRKWLSTLNMFPFVFLPIVLLVAIACAIILPIIRGVGR